MSAWKVTLTLFARRNGRKWQHEAIAWATSKNAAMRAVLRDHRESRTAVGSVIGIAAVPA